MPLALDAFSAFSALHSTVVRKVPQTKMREGTLLNSKHWACFKLSLLLKTHREVRQKQLMRNSCLNLASCNTFATLSKMLVFVATYAVLKVSFSYCLTLHLTEYTRATFFWREVLFKITITCRAHFLAKRRKIVGIICKVRWKSSSN
jgi:hypothetical protein